MFNLCRFFDNFNDRPRYDGLSKILKPISELVFTGKYFKYNNINIPLFDTKNELDMFTKVLERSDWTEDDINTVAFAIKLYKNQKVENDYEAFLLCNILKDLFPDKTDLLDLLIRDILTNMEEDHRKEYLDLFDLDSDLMKMVLFYMSSTFLME